MPAKVLPSKLKGREHSVSVGIGHYDARADGLPDGIDDHRLALYLSGSTRVSQRRDERSYEGIFTRGDLSLVPAGTRVSSRTEAAVDVLTVGFSPAFVDAVLKDVNRDGGRAVELPSVFRFNDPLCRDLSLSMLREAKSGRATARLYIEAAAAVVVLRLARLFQDDARALTRSALPGSVLKRAKDFMRDEMKNNPSLKQVSAAAGMSVYHFSRMFKRSTGLAPHQYFADIRVTQAKALLTDLRMPIAEVAHETGFASPSQFAAFFRKMAGMTPSTFRRVVRAEESGQERRQESEGALRRIAVRGGASLASSEQDCSKRATIVDNDARDGRSTVPGVT